MDCNIELTISNSHMRKFVLETEILGSCKKQIRQFVLIKIKELMCHSISHETTRIINLAKPADLFIVYGYILLHDRLYK